MSYPLLRLVLYFVLHFQITSCQCSFVHKFLHSAFTAYSLLLFLFLASFICKLFLYRYMFL